MNIHVTACITNTYINPFSEEIVFIRQNLMYKDDLEILTYKDDLRAERIKIFILAVDPEHRYSNKAERAN